MSLNNLEKRVTAIENKLRIKPINRDYAQQLAMDACTENEIEMVNEWYQLGAAGFTDDQIRQMLGEEQLAEIARVMAKLRDEENRLLGMTHDDC